MNANEYLLVCLIEEAAEVQQAASKALRFGLNNHHPCRDSTNVEELQNEVFHFLAIIELLNAQEILAPLCGGKDEIIEKIENIYNYMQCSKIEGILEE